MDTLMFLGGGLALLALWWLYMYGLANVIEAVAIVMLKHAGWLRRSHSGREIKQGNQLRPMLAKEPIAIEILESERWAEHWRQLADEGLSVKRSDCERGRA